MEGDVVNEPELLVDLDQCPVSIDVTKMLDQPCVHWVLADTNPSAGAV